MDIKCPSHGDLHFKGEKVKGTSYKDCPFGMCYDHGRVRLPQLRPLPPLLEELVSDEGAQSKHFCTIARAYNSTFQLASTCASTRGEVEGHMKHLWILGRIYHSMGPLQPDAGCPPQFSQLYIYDVEHEIDNYGRVIGDNLYVGLLARVQIVLHESNAFVRSFRAIASHANCSNMQILLHASG